MDTPNPYIHPQSRLERVTQVHTRGIVLAVITHLHPQTHIHTSPWSHTGSHHHDRQTISNPKLLRLAQDCMRVQAHAHAQPSQLPQS